VLLFPDGRGGEDHPGKTVGSDKSGKAMTRTEWLNWRLRWPGPKHRLRDLKFFLKFELYNFVCWMSGYKISHWLNSLQDLPSGPGRYLRVIRPAPFLVRQTERLLNFGPDRHCYYLPYSPEVEADLRLAGKQVEDVELSYQLRVGVY